MWDFVVLKHGHESSQGVLISMILMSSTFNHVGAYFKMNVAP